MRLQPGLGDVPCCLAHDGPHCAGIQLGVERNGQCLFFASFTDPAQFDVAAPLGVAMTATAWVPEGRSSLRDNHGLQLECHQE